MWDKEWKDLEVLGNRDFARPLKDIWAVLLECKLMGTSGKDLKDAELCWIDHNLASPWKNNPETPLENSWWRLVAWEDSYSQLLESRFGSRGTICQDRRVWSWHSV